MTTRNRRGFALPTVTGALVIIGVLVTAGFFIAQQELRIGVASKHANMAVNIAQAGANEVLGNWNGYQLGNIAVWSDTTITDTIANGIWEVSIAMPLYCVIFLAFENSPLIVERIWFTGSKEQRNRIRKWRPRMRKIYPFMIAGAFVVPIGHPPTSPRLTSGHSSTAIAPAGA